MSPGSNQLWLLGGLSALGLLVAWQPHGAWLWKIAAASLLGLWLLDLWRLYRLPLPQVERLLRGSIPVGVWSAVELRLDNSSGQALCLTLHDHHPGDFDCQGLPQTQWLPAGRRLALSYRIRPRQRGDGVFKGVELICHSPLGLWRRRRLIERVERVRVFPNFRKIAHYALLATDNHLSQIGIRRRTRRGEGSDFRQLREYRAGDSLRQIDWKASSRYRRLISKEYQDERDQQLVFLLDCGRHMRHRDEQGAHLDHALNAMLLLSYVAARQGDAVGFLCFGGSWRWQPPHKGGDLIRRLLDRTYDLDASLEAADYLGAAQRLMPLQRRRALVVILTNSRDEDQPELVRAVRLLARRHLVVLAQLREASLDRTLDQPIRGFDDALRLHGVLDYLAGRAQANEALQHQGALLLDTLPARLPVALVNRYLDIKASGVL